MKIGLLLVLMLLPWALYGQSKAVIHGQELRLDKKSGKLLVDQEVTGYDARKGVRFRSDKLEVLRDPTSNKITFAKAQGFVVVTQGMEYASFDQGLYQRNMSLITLTGGVIIGNDQARIEGDRAVYDTETQEAKLQAQPNQQLHFLFHQQNPDDPSAPTEVTGVADEIRVFREQNKAILQGHVQVYDPVEPSQFTAGRVVVFFDDTNQLDEMTASGGFTMKQPGRESTSRRAVLSYNTRLISLLGNAKVQQAGEGEVRGDRVEMHMDVKKGFVRGKRKKPLRIEIPLD